MIFWGKKFAKIYNTFARCTRFNTTNFRNEYEFDSDTTIGNIHFLKV